MPLSKRVFVCKQQIYFATIRCRFSVPGSALRSENICNIYQLCNAFEWDTVEYATRHLYFPYTHEPLYEENTNDKWHVPRYPTRKHCITTLSHAYIFGKLTEIFRRARKSLGISENFGNTSNPFLRSLNDL